MLSRFQTPPGKIFVSEQTIVCLTQKKASAAAGRNEAKYDKGRTNAYEDIQRYTKIYGVVKRRHFASFCHEMTLNFDDTVWDFVSGT